MKYLFTLGMTALLATNVSAKEEALGVSVQGEPTIYFSFELDNGLRIEPSLLFHKSKDSGDTTYEYETYQLLVGIFKVKQHTDKTSIFYGSRIGYLAYHNKSTYAYSEDEHNEGYKIEPTIGFEYKLVDNFSISADASINYSNVNGKGTTDQNTYTDTEVSVRYYFWFIVI